MVSRDNSTWREDRNLSGGERMKYYVKVIDEDDNIVLSIGVHNMDLTRRSDQKMICQQILEVCQHDDDEQMEMF